MCRRKTANIVEISRIDEESDQLEESENDLGNHRKTSR